MDSHAQPERTTAASLRPIPAPPDATTRIPGGGAAPNDPGDAPTLSPEFGTDQGSAAPDAPRTARLETVPPAATTWMPSDPLPPGADLAPTLPHAGPGPDAPLWRARPPQIPGYEVLGELGRGGMGVVYRARQTHLKRLVALKMVLATRSGPDAVARLKAEAETVARLQHPNIVQVYEVGEYEGQPFLALEFVSGGSLDRRIRGTPQSPAASARLIETLARAVHAAHEKHVVHRDLKPANILLQTDSTAEDAETRRGGADGSPLRSSVPSAVWSFVPKVTDFGLAKQLDADTGQTRTGEVMGTPSYMAPEQAEGRIQAIGPATDVYSLGAILYELLTGRPPFQGQTVWETLEQLHGQDPVPPRQLQPKVPRDLETICLKCLRKEPAARYPTARALAEDLQRYHEGRPILARPVGPWERAVKWARRRPAQAGLVAAVALAVLGGLAGSLFYALYKDQQATALDLQAAALRQQLERRQRTDLLWRLGQEAEAAGRLADAKEQWGRALAILDAEPGEADDLRRQIAECRDRVLRLLDDETERRQRRDRAQKFLDGRDDVLFHALSLTDADRAADAAAVCRAAPAALALLGLKADTPPAEVGTLLEPFRRHLPSGPDYDRLAAGCFQVLLSWAEAEADAPPGETAGGRTAGVRQALRLLDLAAGLARAQHVELPRAFHLRRARYLTLLGDADGAGAAGLEAGRAGTANALDSFLAALDHYREGRPAAAAAACEEVLQREPDHFWAQYLQALCHLRGRHWAEARAGLTACLSRRPGFFWARVLLATAQGELRQFAAAAANFDRAWQEAPDPAARWLVLTNRGVMDVRRRHWDEAVRELQQAVGLRPEKYEAHVSLAQAYQGRAATRCWLALGAGGPARAALLYQGRSDWEAAVGALDRAVAGRPEDPALYRTRARLHVLRGDAPQARRDFEQAVARAPADGDAERRASDHVELGYLQHRAGEYPAALASFDAALRLRPGYPPAHRQRAETLWALGRHADAGAALDLYLRTAPPSPEAYQARGLIHAKLRQYAEAVDAYGRALALRPDANTLTYRGWAYLQLEAARPALADFEAALRLQAGHPSARCGRGLARARLGDVPGAVADAEAVLRQDAGTEQLLLNVARTYGRAAGVREAAAATSPRASREAGRYRERAVELLRAVLEQLPAKERPAFWRDQIRTDPDLASLRRSPGLLELARRYAP
jgi:eukaryotic-like serine/threonine-protein kinase